MPEEDETLPEELVNTPAEKADSGAKNPERRAFFKRFLPQNPQKEIAAHPLDTPQPHPPPDISRRTILKRMAAGAAVAASPNLTRVFSSGETRTEIGEVLKPSDRAVFVDMSPNFDNQSMLQDLLGDLYVPPEKIDTNKDILVASDDDRIVATLLASEVLKSREEHGEIMGDKYAETISELGHDVEVPTILPLQEAFSNMEFHRDELGNPSIIMEIDEQHIGDSLEQHFRENPNIQCVNLSLQIGRTRTKQILKMVIPIQKTNEVVIYDEATDTEFITIATDIDTWVFVDGRYLPHRMVKDVLTPLRDDEILTLEQYEQLNHEHEQKVIADYQAGKSTNQIEETYKNETIEMYNPEFARENLARLVALCRRFPDKSFNVSGGNENSFFYEIRQEMEVSGEWVDNLTILAGEPNKSDGSDIYLEEYRFNRIYPISSSESAAKVTALDSLLANQGIPLSERQQKIRKYCQSFEFQTNAGNPRKALSLDPHLYTKGLSNQSQNQ